MKLFKKNKFLVTHNGIFHADDIFATAALSILFDGAISVKRTRDEEVIAQADFVYDVGGEHDPARNRFDHHQKGGAGARTNGIPYAAFGLVWKTYGEKICHSKEVAEKVDEELVQAIDAYDNGMELCTVDGEVKPFFLENAFTLFRPSWKEEEEYDTPFMELVDFAKKVLQRKIKKVADRIESYTTVEKAYADAEDKRLIVLDKAYPWEDVLEKYSEPLYVVIPKLDTWRVLCVREKNELFANKKSLPEAWAGLRDEALAKVTGVSDATFCHNARFIAVAKSREGAVELAKIALAH